MFVFTVPSVNDMMSSHTCEPTMERLKPFAFSAVISIAIVAILPLLINFNLISFAAAILLVFSIITPVIKRWMPKKVISPTGKAVFISGCDTGFGHLLAQRLCNLGFQVFAGCLLPDDDGARKLKKLGSSRVHVISLDVTNETSVWEAAAYVKGHLNNHKLWAVVNNAGILTTGALHWADMDAVKKVFDVNSLGPIRVTQAFLSMLRDAKGRVINVASAAGRVRIPGCLPYCMSKSAVVCFSAGLRMEMRKWGIQVAGIEPMAYKTSFTDKEGMLKQIRESWGKAPKDTKDCYDSNYISQFMEKYMELLDSFNNQNPSDVVDAMEESIMDEFPENTYVVGPLFQRFGAAFVDLMPQFIVDFVTLDFVTDKENQ